MLDPLASVVICIFILKVAFDIFKDALDKMLDTSCSEEYEEKLADYIRKSRGVERLDLLRTRMFGNKVYIDAEIAVDGTLSLKDAHAIAEDVHDNVEKKFPNTKHIMIHVNPGIMEKIPQLSNFEKAAVFFSLLVLSEKFNSANESMFSFVL